MRSILILFLSLALMGQGQAQPKIRVPWRTITAIPGSGSATQPSTSNNTVTLTVTFATSTSAASATATVTPLWANKDVFVSYERDDAISTSTYGTIHDFAFLTGGTDPSGNTYPGKTSTDGCGNAVKWTAGAAINARNNNDNKIWIGQSGRLTLDQLTSLVQNRWSILNHGYYHELSSVKDDGTTLPNINYAPPASTPTLNRAAWSIARNTQFLDSMVTTKGERYITRVVVRPSNWKGYVRAADSLKCIGITSTGTVETEYGNYPSSVAYSQGGTTTNFVWIENLPTTGYSKFNNNGFVQLVRLFPADPWSNTTTTTLKAQFADMLSKAAPTKHLGMRFATHVNTPGSFQEFFNYVDSLGQDRIWVVGMHQEREYQEVRRLASLSRSVSGNTVTIRIDMSAIPDINRFRDISLLVTGGGTITNVTSTGPHDRITYNTSTGLINVFWEKKSGFPIP